MTPSPLNLTQWSKKSSCRGPPPPPASWPASEGAVEIRGNPVPNWRLASFATARTFSSELSSGFRLQSNLCGKSGFIYTSNFYSAFSPSHGAQSKLQHEITNLKLQLKTIKVHSKYQMVHCCHHCSQRRNGRRCRD